jgi:hypothetical protein
MSRTRGSSRATPRPGRRALRGLVAEAGQHQPLGERRRPAYADRLAVAGRPAAARRGVLGAGGDVEHHAGDHLAVDLGGDRDGVLRDAVEEVHGAVDRVDDPAHAGAGRSSSPSSPRTRRRDAPRGSRSRISASLARSASVTTSTALDLVAAT